MPLVFLGLGSNVGDSNSLIRSAFVELGLVIRDARLSRLYRSAPMYVVDQPDFVNAVAMGECMTSPHALLVAVQEIERRHGRDRSSEQVKGPRPLDIDLLLFGDLVVADAELTLPHPGLLERRFALEPLLELAPEALDPRSGLPLRASLALLPPQGIYVME